MALESRLDHNPIRSRDRTRELKSVSEILVGLMDLVESRMQRDSASGRQRTRLVANDPVAGVVVDRIAPTFGTESTGVEFSGRGPDCDTKTADFRDFLTAGNQCWLAEERRIRQCEIFPSMVPDRLP